MANSLEFLKPRMRLFLSVDVDSSTAQKQMEPHPLSSEQADQPPDTTESLEVLTSKWMVDLAVFYREFDQKVVFAWESATQDSDIATAFSDTDPGRQVLRKVAANKPELFKMLGDELIYSLEFDDVEPMMVHLCLWLRALSTFSENELGGKFSVKSTAWIAGFPVSNHEIVTQREPSGAVFEAATSRDAVFAHWFYLGLYYNDFFGEIKIDKNKLNRDFVGPSMDSGFRVSQLSSSKKMAITPELAYLLGSQVSTAGTVLQEKRLKIYYDGKRKVDGLSTDGYYPFFWINTDGNPKYPEEEVFGDNFKKGPVSKTGLRTYRDAFIASTKGMIAPYLPSSINIDVSTEPPGFWTYLQQLETSWNREWASFLEGGELPPSGDGDYPDDLLDFKNGLP